MIVVGLIGGLGNQMFQYAAARALADKHQTGCFLDVRDFAHYTLHSFGLARLNIRAEVAEKNILVRYPLWQKTLMRRLPVLSFHSKWYFETRFAYNDNWPSFDKDLYLSGYFQSEKYFQSIAGQLKKDFVPRQALSEKNLSFQAMMRNSDSVMVHVRRGDYVNNSKTLQVHGVCSLAYYQEALSLMASRVKSPRYFVFSDDLKWAQTNLALGEEAVYVEGNADNPENDLYLMSQCRHHIIANSTFSWWGAWLAQHHEQIVIRPEPWFDKFPEEVKDLVPTSWLSIKK